LGVTKIGGGGNALPQTSKAPEPGGVGSGRSRGEEAKAVRAESYNHRRERKGEKKRDHLLSPEERKEGKSGDFLSKTTYSIHRESFEGKVQAFRKQTFRQGDSTRQVAHAANISDLSLSRVGRGAKAPDR